MKSLRVAFFDAISALVAGCVPIPTYHVEYRDPNVKIIDGEVFFLPWPGFIDRWSHMKVYGHYYAPVRGCVPCYLEVPEIDSLLFVTGHDGDAVVHLVNTRTHKRIQFPAYDSTIGNSIQQPTGDETAQFEKVENITGDLLVITAYSKYETVAGKNFNYKYYIDLKERKFLREECDYYSKRDKDWRHYVYIDGKKPK